MFIETTFTVITTIGVYGWEQEIQQKIGIRYRNGSNGNRPAAASDKVEDCLSYADVSETVITHVRDGRFALLSVLLKSWRKFCWRNLTLPGSVSRSVNLSSCAGRKCRGDY